MNRSTVSMGLAFVLALHLSGCADTVAGSDSEANESEDIRPEPQANGVCCRVCSKGVACGNTCIAAGNTCHVGAGCACNLSSSPPEIAGLLLVALDARDSTAAGVWKNHGTLGDFQAVGTPQSGAYMGVPAIYFDGASDAYIGPASVASIEAASDRTIEVWVNNPNVESHEETMVSWSERSGPIGTMLSFNYGYSGYWGAATHWQGNEWIDLGWGATGVPGANLWHHLVYTYDGSTARVYQDGALKSEEAVSLATKAAFPINVGAQRRAGQIQFTSEYDGTQQAGSLWLAVVRIHDGALSAQRVKANFDAEKARFLAN